MGPRATEGDTILVVATAVRANKREDFDQFVDAFWSAGLRSDRRGFQHVRVLLPTAANPDGTFTYFFVFDPMPTGDLALEPEVRKLFPAPDAERLLRQFEGAVAGEQKVLRVVQSRF